MPRRAATPRARDPIAEPLHRNALRLLRLLRRADVATGVSAARLSALSVLVFGGPCSPSALAAAEQVSAPTMTRLVQELEREGWVRRVVDPTDARSARLAATPAAIRLLHRGRERRLAALGSALTTLSANDRRAIAAALEPLARLVGALSAMPSGAAAGSRTVRPGRRRFD